MDRTRQERPRGDLPIPLRRRRHKHWVIGTGKDEIGGPQTLRTPPYFVDCCRTVRVCLCSPARNYHPLGRGPRAGNEAGGPFDCEQGRHRRSTHKQALRTPCPVLRHRSACACAPCRAPESRAAKKLVAQSLAWSLCRSRRRAATQRNALSCRTSPLRKAACRTSLTCSVRSVGTGGRSRHRHRSLTYSYYSYSYFYSVRCRTVPYGRHGTVQVAVSFAKGLLPYRTVFV